MEFSFKDRAVYDILSAKILISEEGNPTHDEGLYDIASYHVQQGIEKVLKDILLTEGGMDENQIKIHDIDILISIVENKTAFTVPDELKEMAGDLTSWEVNSRYGSSEVATVQEIAKGISLYESLQEEIDNWRDEIEKEKPEIEVSEQSVEYNPIDDWDDDSDLGSLD